MGLLADAKIIAQRDPAGKSLAQVIFLYSGFHALFYHRIAHWLYRHRRYFLARMVSQFSRFCTGIEIHPGAKIGSGLFIDHGMGVVIGETAAIGNDCTIYHNVTLGGTGKGRCKRHPTIGDNVLIGAGAKILGPFSIGDCSMIGANAVVLNEVPPASTVVGVPGKIVKQNGEPIPHNIELDHGNSPDPVEQEICALLKRVLAIEKELNLSSAMSRSVSNKINCPEANKDQTQASSQHDGDKGGTQKHEDL